MEHRLLLAAGRRAADEDRFARLKTLQAGGESRAAIVREIGLNWRTVAKWIRLDTLPARRAMAPKTTTPEHFRAYLARRWAEGSTMGGTCWRNSYHLVTPEASPICNVF